MHYQLTDTKGTDVLLEHYHGIVSVISVFKRVPIRRALYYFVLFCWGKENATEMNIRFCFVVHSMVLSCLMKWIRFPSDCSCGWEQEVYLLIWRLTLLTPLLKNIKYTLLCLYINKHWQPVDFSLLFFQSFSNWSSLAIFNVQGPGMRPVSKSCDLWKFTH